MRGLDAGANNYTSPDFPYEPQYKYRCTNLLNLP